MTHLVVGITDDQAHGVETVGCLESAGQQPHQRQQGLRFQQLHLPGLGAFENRFVLGGLLGERRQALLEVFYFDLEPRLRIKVPLAH